MNHTLFIFASYSYKSQWGDRMSEFEKRFKEKRHLTGPAGNEFSIIEEDEFLEIVKDARREFPNSKNFIKHQDEHAVHEVDWDSYDEAVIAYRKKWFGI